MDSHGREYIDLVFRSSFESYSLEISRKCHKLLVPPSNSFTRTKSARRIFGVNAMVSPECPHEEALEAETGTGGYSRNLRGAFSLLK